MRQRGGSEYDANTTLNNEVIRTMPFAPSPTSSQLTVTSRYVGLYEDIHAGSSSETDEGSPTFYSTKASASLSLTISILIKEAEGFLEFSNLFFGQLIGHGE
jgi:hypothetical protein